MDVLTGYERLATRLLYLAVKDAQGRNAEHRASAVDFLASEYAQVWADLLGYDLSAYRRGIETLTQGPALSRAA